MKTFNILLVFFVLNTTVPCLFLQAQNKESTAETHSKHIFGESFEPANVKIGQEILNNYNALAASDSVQMQVQAEVSSVCQMKGCWLNLVLVNGEEVLVTFKDYSFFVPKDIAGKLVVINGVAQVTEISEEDQKHFARDAGQTEKEVNKIKGKINKYSMVAEGVIIKE